MGKYVLKRVVSIFITLFIVCTLTFAMMHAVPGGPFTGERNLPPKVLEVLNKKYHLDDPVLVQYGDYLKGIVTLDLGPSYKKDGVMVKDMLMQGFPVSAKLGFITSLLIILVGVPLGIFSALKRGRWPDYIVTILATLGIAVPTFVLGTLILYVFGAKLNWIPTFGLDSWKCYIGPAVSLSGFSIAFVLRLTRSSMLEVMGQDYIRTARAKGLSWGRVIGKHALKNALIPVVTYIGPMIAGIMSGSFVTEKIFAIPGMGKFFVDAITNRDYTVIMGTTLFYAAFAGAMILVVDIVYVLLDPRIKIDG
ncbi:MAG: ABC transporter permease [Clostridia bacterium]